MLSDLQPRLRLHFLLYNTYLFQVKDSPKDDDYTNGDILQQAIEMSDLSMGPSIVHDEEQADEVEEEDKSYEHNEKTIINDWTNPKKPYKKSKMNKFSCIKQ